MAAGDWSGARDAFAAVLGVAEVPEALVGLANACYWLADLTVMMQSLERAHAAARQRPDPVMAAGAAMALVGYHKQFIGNVAAARGWLARATRIVEAEAPQLRGELLGGTVVPDRRSGRDVNGWPERWSRSVGPTGTPISSCWG